MESATVVAGVEIAVARLGTLGAGVDTVGAKSASGDSEAENTAVAAFSFGVGLITCGFARPGRLKAVVFWLSGEPKTSVFPSAVPV